MIIASQTFFEKCVAGVLSALLGVFVVISCCTPVTPACCQKAETNTSQAQHTKMAFIATSCCMEQDDHAVLPLTPTPKIKFLSIVSAPNPTQVFPQQSLNATHSLIQQVFHKDQSKRYLELGIFLS